MRTTLPVPNADQYWARLHACAPIHASVAAQPGALVTRMSDQAPAAVLRQTPFYREFMEPEGWRYAVALIFWERGRPVAHLGINRTEAQGDFTDEELGVIEEAHPEFARAIARITRLDRQKAEHHAMAHAITESPLPLMLLDWDLRPLAASRAAETACREWCGSNPALAKLPPAIGAACVQLQEEWKAALLTDRPKPYQREANIVRDQSTPWIARVRMIAERSSKQTARPWFEISFSTETGAHPMAAPDPSAMSMLTTAERGVAGLAREGLGNQEIAAQLFRSPHTVRAQLRSIYAKLRVRTRAELVARLSASAGA